MLPTSVDETSECEEMKARRNLLFKQFVAHPSDIHMSVDIKKIDDQIAELNERMREAHTIASKTNARRLTPDQDIP
jgi:hypothetical protein